tara:strand:+ start:803 stop:2197 length:1395 start_codon:yes stop_codon:yes gene_type:complete
MQEKFIENIEVVDISSKGKGICKDESGKVIFVEGVVPGDLISLKIKKKRKNYFEGQNIKILKPSKDRISPKCDHFGLCGGCKFQNLSYNAQLEFKQKQILYNLKNFSEMNIPKLSRIKKAKKIYFYRNKMEFSFSEQKWLTKEEIEGNNQAIIRKGLGFHKSGAWNKVVDIRKCHLQEDPSNEIRNSIRDFAIKNNFKFFDYKSNNGFLRSLMIRSSSTGFMVLIQFFKENKNKRIKLLDFLTERFPEIKSLLYCINSKRNDSIYDQEIICYQGSDHIVEKIEGYKFKITAKSFFQTNSYQIMELNKIILQFASLKKSEIVYDLYTGTGTIAVFLAKYCKKVIGIDLISDAIESAKENVFQNKIKNVFFELGDMKNIFNHDFITRNGKAAVVIVDPPRDGMHKNVIKELIKLSPDKIIYVSCNSSTQARDLKLLKFNYSLLKSKAIDMFPHTQHVENIVLLGKI